MSYIKTLSIQKIRLKYLHKSRTSKPIWIGLSVSSITSMENNKLIVSQKVESKIDKLLE